MAKPKVLDRTKNFSGPDNMMPADRLQPDCLTTLYDEFVRDGWMKPEDRMEGLAFAYRSQRNVAQRELMGIRRHAAEKEYARGWIGRVMEWQKDEAK